MFHKRCLGLGLDCEGLSLGGLCTDCQSLELLAFVFANLDKLTKHLDPARLAVTEAVFGVLLAALAVQMMVDGLAALGIISAIVGH